MTTIKRTTFDGVIRQDVESNDTEFLRTTTSQPERGKILRFNERRRLDEVNQDLSFGRLTLTIPVLDYELLLKHNPDLRSDDRETRLKAWKRFTASPAAAPYRVGKT